MSRDGTKGRTGSRERELIMAALDQVSPETIDTRTATSPPPRAVDLPPEVFPGYDVLGEIHRGGQGVVYQAIQRATRRRVAIKVMHEGISTGSAGRTRFEREVQVLGQMSHPGIVKIHDSGVTKDGSFFYVMDYISGKPFDEFIRQKKDEESTQTGQRSDLELFAKICEAVNGAHLKGVIHRDLKPANIRLDENGQPIVVDFGLAKVAVPDMLDETAGQVMTTTGHFVGSLPWASPEQADGSPSAIDIRTDVYSLGVILYQLLTGGKFPYVVSGNMREVLENIQLAEPAKPSTYVGRRRINDELETIVLKALQKDRNRRYQSAGDLGRDIRRYLAGEPIEAKRDSGWYLVTKTMRRHRTAAGVAAGFMLFGVVFAVTMTVLYREAEAARIVATESEEVARTALGTAEQERARAESNFKAVRDLAHTFMFDFHDEIRNLRGATRARELLLVEATDYLKKLSLQASDDPSLLAELAEAHERVGDILGGMLRANTGDSQTADAHYAEARRLRELLVRAKADDPDRVAALADITYRSAGALRKNGEFDRAEREYRDAVARYDEALLLVDRVGEGQTPRVRMVEGRVDALLGVGQTRARRAITAREMAEAKLRVDAAMDAYDEAELAVLDDAAALGEHETSKLQAAVTDQRAKLMTEWAARQASMSGREQDEARARELAESAVVSATEGVTLARKAADQFGLLAGARSEDAELGRDLVLATGAVSNGYYRLGLSQRALAGLGGEDGSAESFALALSAGEATLDLARSMAKDLSDLDAQRNVGWAMNHVGNALRELGRIEEAATTYGQMVLHREDVHRADPTPMLASDLGVAYVKKGEVEENLGDLALENGRPGEAGARFESALSRYRQGLSAMTEAEPGSGSARLAAVERMIEGVQVKLGNLEP